MAPVELSCSLLPPGKVVSRPHVACQEGAKIQYMMAICGSKQILNKNCLFATEASATAEACLSWREFYLQWVVNARCRRDSRYVCYRVPDAFTMFS
jgi:hypothetical protein